MSWAARPYASEEVEMNPGKIRGKGRPRFGRGGVYSSPSDSCAEREIEDAWIAEVGDSYSGWTDEVRVSIDYQRRYPASAPKYRQGDPDLTKPDVDNVAKTVLDALNKTAYKDDSQVTELRVRKFPRFLRRSPYLRIRVDYIANEPPRRENHGKTR